MAEPDETCDVLVAGSGSAGLAAALRTSAAGLSTIILERTGLVGGTTAMSGAAVWIPANHHAAAAGLSDDRERALTYIRAVAPDGWRETEDALWRSFVDEAPNMLAFLERETPLRFSLMTEGDPHLEKAGAVNVGRMLSPGVLRRKLAGPYARILRPPSLPHVFTFQEMLELDPFHHPVEAAFRRWPQLFWRLLTGARGMGTALVTGLLKGCLHHGCRIALEARAVAPIVEKGRVKGLVVEAAGAKRSILARKGVVLATGGFEWNNELREKHFPGHCDFIASPPGNDGDAVRIAVAAGAELAHMDQANITGGFPLSGSRRPFGVSSFFHQEPNAIVVNRHGRRFVNEYRFNLGEVIDERDPSTGQPVHLPAWLVSDQAFLENSPILRHFAARNPGWTKKAQTFSALAEATKLPADEFARTIERFNASCASGVDGQFHREGMASGQAKKGPGKSRLSPIQKAPFIAIPFNRTIVSTKGGPRTDAGGRVLRADGRVVEGLYCVGVAMANPFGTWAVGAGTTLGPNLTWGYICAKSIICAND
ncbi:MULTISPECIES: FAD-dependent oxidoreductase [unclassified Mesorhizobium]|uniref:FAD-dependent oxidoreductase n=1 Tax=unclassified Mesorhizobium TaxID=325217 RepID=UPI00112B06D9|nr:MULTISPECIES: FAD-dependent oxidoreductase [unclassified Mesorhizobium]MBZ9918029.1 FAD-dependent oxidoreductase [Mesorhizobium sp. BR1-1-7]MBZ9956235.1 FAD-dependent oxidoreductase [Mesorhizobium sp. BR1-1-15]MBZ9973213.1 FAD-dependent oxidoreductase [Mesorhizobium sp. BR1-1-12]TPK49019.1 FAD-dependent oxidoreductase [Mesorhizobium sp. B2-5-2]TPL23634.1 FAD-dependent oxidoreductase [Mesorhizobium sp. B2-4-7]